MISGKALESFIKNTLKPRAIQYCGPLHFTSSLQDSSGVNSNGTFGLIDTGERKLLVTNHHVIEGFNSAKQQEPNLKICIALNEPNLIVLDEALLLDPDPDVDLATFDMSPLLGECRTKAFYNVPLASIAKVNPGDKVFFIGFPGNSRRIEERAVISGTVPYAIEVDACGAKHFVSNIDRLRHLDKDDNPVPVGNMEHGGASGSPCFLVAAKGELQLAGFVKESISYLISIALASLIKPDGTIDRSFNEVRA